MIGHQQIEFESSADKANPDRRDHIQKTNDMWSYPKKLDPAMEPHKWKPEPKWSTNWYQAKWDVQRMRDENRRDSAMIGSMSRSNYVQVDKAVKEKDETLQEQEAREKEVNGAKVQAKKNDD